MRYIEKFCSTTAQLHLVATPYIMPFKAVELLLMQTTSTQIIKDTVFSGITIDRYVNEMDSNCKGK
jgi:hypothetical protein